ncbi:MAG: hypothetical protein M3R36_13285 [Bacteroidota bacterium]|nr:hypothetical protein [Bacteroidota bacterium]
MVGDIISGVKFLFEAISSKKNKSKENRQIILTNFVDPIYVNFESVHKEYLESFQNYRTIIATTELPLILTHPLFELMQKDHALSDMDRAKIVSMSEYLNNYNSDLGKQIAKEPAGRFAHLVIDYVMTPAHELTQSWKFNFPRKNLLIYLESISESDKSEMEKKNLTTVLLDNMVESLQEKYMRITKEYMKLKEKLLI